MCLKITLRFEKPKWRNQGYYIRRYGNAGLNGKCWDVKRPGWLFSAFLVFAVSRVPRKSNVCLDNCNGSYYAVHMYFGVSNMKDESNFPLKTTYN